MVGVEEDNGDLDLCPIWCFVDDLPETLEIIRSRTEVGVILM